MTLVDSGVWIDFFRGVTTHATDTLNERLRHNGVVGGDLIIAEVLRGFLNDRDFDEAREVLTALDIVEIGGTDLAIEAAQNYRRLRAKGITVRKTIDTLIATRCIQNDLELLYSDRDFDGFVLHLGLRSALPPVS